MDDNTDLIISISTDQATLRRSIKRIEQDLSGLAGSVKKQFDAVGKSVDSSVSSTLQDRINAMVGVGAKGAKEWTGALADQGKELERLRAKYSPLFTTINNYKTAVTDIKRAHALGAISATEMTAAISRERQAALASTAAIKGRNAAIAQGGLSAGAQQANTANIAFQLQDIATTAPFMNPLTVALQQGPQLASVFQTMGSGKEIVGGLAAAFGSLISPVSLVTVGLVAGGAALIQYFTSASDGAKSADDAIKEHDAAIRGLREAYGIAGEGLDAYARKTQVAAKAAARIDVKTQKDALDQAAKEFNSSVTQSYSVSARFGGAPDVAVKFKPFSDAIRDLQKTIADGKPNFAAFQVSVERIADTDPTKLRGLADELINGSSAAAEAEQRMNMAKASIGALGAIANDQIASIAGLTSALSELSKIGVQPLTELQQIDEAYRKALANAKDRNERDDATAARDAAKKRVADNNPVVTGVDGVPVAVPVPGQKPSQLDEKPDATVNKTANAYRDLIKSANDRIAQVQQEIELTGKFGVEAEAARFKLDLLQQAEEKGRKLSQQRRDEINKKAEAYKKLSLALAGAKLSENIARDQRDRTLGATDRKILETQRNYGLPEGLQGAQAEQIRRTIQQNDLADGIHSFFTDFEDALVKNGESLGDALGDAIKNAALNVMNKQLEDIFSKLANNLSNVLIGAFTGDSSSGFAGSVAKVATSSLGKAPVTAVTRAPLADISSYAKAIQSIESGGNYGALGPITKSGDRAYGAYQVMGSNIPAWTKGATGQALTPSQFLTSQQAQDQVFNKYFGSSVSKFGNPQDAASVWFTGRPLSKGANAADVLGTTGTKYVEKFNTALGKLGSTTDEATDGLGDFGSGLNKFGQNLSNAFPAAPSGGGGGGGGLADLFRSLIFPDPTSFSPQAASLAPGILSGASVGLFADGGHVSGPGSGTSDSVPAMLSDGEFVVKAAMTRKHRALLEAINNGRVNHFASGGIVRGGARGAASASGGVGGGGVVVNIVNNTASQVKQQSKETSSGIQIDVLVDELVADKMATPGSRSRGAMTSQFGLKGGLARR